MILVALMDVDGFLVGGVVLGGWHAGRVECRLGVRRSPCAVEPFRLVGVETGFQVEIGRVSRRDIAAMSLAVPYCDVVVTDSKAWAVIVKRARLDREFDTAVFKRLVDLGRFLTESLRRRS